MFARLHDDASFGPAGRQSEGREGKAGMLSPEFIQAYRRGFYLTEIS